MQNIIPLRPVDADEQLEPIHQRPRYSYDISQPDAGGFVLIDACVPVSLAVEFMNLITNHNIAKLAQA